MNPVSQQFSLGQQQVPCIPKSSGHASLLFMATPSSTRSTALPKRDGNVDNPVVVVTVQVAAMPCP